MTLDAGTSVLSLCQYEEDSIERIKVNLIPPTMVSRWSTAEAKTTDLGNYNPSRTLTQF